jgi:hypothetical protein
MLLNDIQCAEKHPGITRSMKTREYDRSATRKIMEGGFGVEPSIPSVEHLSCCLLLFLLLCLGSLLFCKSLISVEKTLERAHCGGS